MGKFLLPEFTQIKVPSPNREKNPNTLVTRTLLYVALHTNDDGTCPIEEHREEVIRYATGRKEGEIASGLGLKALILARESHFAFHLMLVRRNGEILHPTYDLCISSIKEGYFSETCCHRPFHNITDQSIPRSSLTQALRPLSPYRSFVPSPLAQPFAKKKDGAALIQDLWKAAAVSSLVAISKNRKKILYDGGTTSFSFFCIQLAMLHSRNFSIQSSKRLIVPTCMGHKGYTFAKLTAPA
ncbi:hypothetical protein IFM89_000684, partial [Coptis chinensis]